MAEIFWLLMALKTTTFMQYSWYPVDILHFNHSKVAKNTIEYWFFPNECILTILNTVSLFNLDIWPDISVNVYIL